MRAQSRCGAAELVRRDCHPGRSEAENRGLPVRLDKPEGRRRIALRYDRDDKR